MLKAWYENDKITIWKLKKLKIKILIHSFWFFYGNFLTGMNGMPLTLFMLFSIEIDWDFPFFYT